MHSTRHASHKRYDLPKMHNRCSAPKLQCIKYVPNLALSTQGFSCDWYIWRTVQAITVRSFNSIQFIGCSVTNRGHRSLYIDSDAGGKRLLGVLPHGDREVFAWVRFFAWILKCPSGHCYYWLLDWITLLVKFSGNFRFSWWIFLEKAKQLQRSPNVIKHWTLFASHFVEEAGILIYNQLGCSSSGGHRRAMSGPT